MSDGYANVEIEHQLRLARAVLSKIRARGLGNQGDDQHVCILIGGLKRGVKLSRNEREELERVARKVGATT